MSEEVENLFHRRILTMANTFAEQIALTDCDTGKSLTFADLRRKSAQLAAILQSQFQIGQGDFLLCLLPNSVNYSLILLAGALLGAPISGAPPDSSADELEMFVTKTQCRAIFAANNSAHLDWLQTKTTILDIQLFLLDKLADQPGIDFNGLLDLDNGMDDHEITAFLSKSPDNSFSLDAIFVAPMSSGASGIPKVVIQTHRNYIAATDILKRAVFDELTEEGGGRRSTIAAQPFHHASGLWILFYCLLIGHRSLVMRKFNSTLYLGLIEEYKIDTISLGPWLISLLLKQNLANYNLSSIRHIISGGSSEATNAVQNAKFLSNFPKAKNFLIGYGMTEIVLISHMTPLNMDKNDGRRLHSVGKLLPGFEYKIVDCLNGEDITGQVNARGELWLHSECIMAGYLNESDELNKKTIDKDGWFRTGDVLWEDKDGFFFYVDRLANLILVNEQAVWSAELEFVLLTHPKVLEACVIGVENEQKNGGQMPIAYLLLRDENENEEMGKILEQIRQFANAHLNEHQQIGIGGLFPVHSLPKTPFGKVAKQKVREMDAKEKSTKMATYSKETMEIVTICPDEEIASRSQFSGAKMKELMRESPSNDDELLALKIEKNEATKPKMLVNLASQEEGEEINNLNLEEVKVFEEEDENDETVL